MKPFRPNTHISDEGSTLSKGWGIRLIVMLLLFPFLLWGIFAFWWGAWPRWLGLPLIGVYVVAHMASILFSPKRQVIPLFLVAFLLPFVCFLGMQPSHNRTWPADVALMPYAEINGNKIKVYHVRNCDYLTETEFVPHYETRTYDLSKLQSVDVMLTDWGLNYVAHTMVSFGFEGDNYLCFSIETRKEMGESYSAIKGFFRQYELIYIAGDERDLVRLRTNFRKGEDVYLYRFRVSSMDTARMFFNEYINRINELYKHPQWYNALTENCMTSAFRLARMHAASGRGKWHWSVILNGLADRHAYARGTIDTSLPFDELKRRSRINDHAIMADNLPDFSKRIRAGLPGMAWKPDHGVEDENSL